MKLFFTLFFIGISLGVFGQTNNCSITSTLLTVSTTCSPSSFVNTQNGSDTPPASCGSSTNRRDVWFRFVGTGGSVIIALSDLNLDASLAVFAACTSGELVCNMATNLPSEEVILNTVSGTTYYIQIQRWNGGNGEDLDGNICIYNYVAPPSNDSPCSASVLNVNSYCDFTGGSNLNALTSTSVLNPGCGIYYGLYDTWYKFTVPASGKVEIKTYAGSLSDAAMAIYSGSCSSLTLLACNDDYSIDDYMPYIYKTGLTPGATIWVRVWGYGGVQGTFEICVTEVNIPGDNP